MKNGQSLSDIGRALGKHVGSIHGVISSNGGIAPAARCRLRLVLSLAEREKISRGMAVSASMRQIAIMIGRAPSTVSREIARNGGRNKYRASEADALAWDQARRPKQCRLGMNDSLQNMVAAKLSLD